MFRFASWTRYRLFATTNRGLYFRGIITASVIPRSPPSYAPREVPTPLVFVSANSLDPDSGKEMSTLSTMLSEKGFTCFQIDLSARDATASTKEKSHDALIQECSELVRLNAIPFPPVIIARSASCLISQKYISSYPATGLVLISPPKDDDDLEKTGFPTPMNEFIYEPKFPIAVMDTPERVAQLKKDHRLCKDPHPFVDIVAVTELEGQPLLQAVDLWLDELGV
ncbi:hypothetical protein CC1G_03662 [Coprinopsis cinerea okayama7|uniref:Uncharacterized protein n=1 Tax=Coprinopsis cinerea (strain Okayama-7 / 130 / ATCC MYA-4618 / FGSC 9003) TaxID=240176 RepID=A8N1W9_COPC7|nr:hypothetical protein CC1G_03662 [Coprinopsis cinerea okayama7\|eukprot:XP_001828868.2 hypothetical protein CC1G_03662 [Coprinopsis cinerea okayama7\